MRPRWYNLAEKESLLALLSPASIKAQLATGPRASHRVQRLLSDLIQGLPKGARRDRSVERFGFFTVKCDALGEDQTLHHLLNRDPCLWTDTPTGAFSRL